MTMRPAIKYALAALLLLGATFQAIAADTHYTSYETAWASCQAAKTSTYGEGCFNYSAPNPKYVQRRNNFEGLTFEKYFYYISGSCPSGMQDSNGDGLCEELPQCEAGSDTMFVRYTFTEAQQPNFYTDQAQIQNGGCIYDSVGVEECGVYSDGVKACLFEYSQTDEPATGSESEPEEYTQGDSPQGNTTNDTGQTTYTEDPPVTNPDGSTTQTTNETTTNTTGSGTTMWNDDDYIYFRDSTGTTTVYDRQKTTTTNTDGSVDENVTTTKSTQTPSTTTTTVNKNTGNTTVTNNNQSTTNSTTTTTNNYYDSEGNLTGSDSTTTGGSETENEGDENKEGNCGAPGQPACDVSLEGEDSLQDPAGILDDNILPKLDEMITKLEEAGQTDISSDLVQFSPLNLYESGSCDPNAFSTTYHTEQFRPLEGFCSFYDADIRPILAFFFYCLTAWALYLIYANTMRKT
jgi:hypothetical protein